MSLITNPNTYSTGEVISASQINASFSTIYNDYNGNITNANFASSIAITDNHLNQITTAAKVSGTALTGLASIPSGAGVIPAANLTYVNVVYPYVKVSNTQSSGTNGGTATSGSWGICPINTTDTDTQSISSLATNQVTLPAGTYEVRGRQVFFQTVLSQIRLQNITASTTLLTGESQASGVGDNTTIGCSINGLITLASSSALSLEYQVSSTKATNGLGTACSFGNEVYATIEFKKIA
jgi:hypothetical protein